MLGRHSADHTEYFPAGATLDKKNKNQKEETKLQNPESPTLKKLLHATLHRENRRAPALPDSSSKSA
jgi:hypothetical protein